MDFLWLFITYVTFLVVCIFAFCFLSERSRNGLDRVLHRADTVLSLVLPTWLQRRYKNSFQTRNGAFVILHLILDILVFAEYSCEVLGYCLELEMNWPFIFLPSACISVNLYFFYRCCAADPGIVNRKNEASYVQLYEYDSILFHPENQCPTCQLTKPARSKHCSVCGCCVHRFDHHCVWVNNCIGGLNMRYFLIYLISLTLTALSLAAVITTFLLKVVLLSHMMSATFIDPDGLEQLVNMVFIIQHLFMTFPRIVFTLGFLCVLVLLLGVYSAFMLYLGLTNQTTNEWHKLKGRSLAAGSRKGYSKGILGNILEIFQPRTCHKKDR